MTNLHIMSAKWTSVLGMFVQVLAYALLSPLKGCIGTLQVTHFPFCFSNP